MNQHDYVQSCIRLYDENGIIPGDPEEGTWNDAHYPAPKGEGIHTIPLLWEHHQVQGILQSEEYGKCCFWLGDARYFLNNGPFVEGWFELWDLYEKWSSVAGRKAVEKAHSRKDSSGKSILGVSNGKKQAARMNEVIHREKDDRGRSLAGVRASERLHEVKDESGKSVRGVNLAKNTNKQLWECTITGYISNPGALTNYQKAKGIDTKNRIKIS
jgi:hypothetical protein